MSDIKTTTAGPPAETDHFLAGGGEMGKLIRAMDWSRTPLGPIASWPQSLRTTVSLCIASNFPISMAWGPNHIQIYNDGYWPICGAKHPHSMGQDFRECWASAWPAIGEAFNRALAGESQYIVNRRMFLDRNGYLEETFFTFSFSPIRDETGGIGGLFHPVTETTAKMLSERRTRALRDLAARTGKAQAVEDAFTLAAETLAEYELDLPFVLLYLIDAEGKQARLISSAGLAPGTIASPELVNLDAPPSASWPLAEVVRSCRTERVDHPEMIFGPLSCGPYPETPKTALALPIVPPGSDRPAGILVAGASPRLPLDEEYRSFYDLLTAAVTAAVANALAYEEERKRAEALAEIDRAKTLFFSNVSHEFRTPLTLMLGPLADVLANADDRLPAAEREQIALAYRNGLRLLRLVNALLDFSRIEAGRAQASYEPTDLAAFTAELASNFRSACERARLKLEVDCPHLPEPVYVDQDMWEKIVLNLISNAFKFTHRGEIAVTLRPVGETAELVVRDTGVGIPEDQLARIFERFHRVEGARGRTYEGSGIGLALVRELVNLHGGSVRADSALNQGTTFTVSVPFGSAHLPADRIGAARTLASTAIGATAFVEEALRWLPDGETAGTGDAPAARIDTAPLGPSGNAAPGPDGTTARILWADDNADMRDYVRRLLAGRYAVEAVADGAAALAAARANPPDLVLADVMMPRLDGFGLLRELRADPRTRALPVILLSARAGEESRVEGLGAGASDYLIKPFSSRELLARVDAQLNMARLSHAARRELAERKRAEKALRQAVRDKEVLLRELQHRTKNNLQVITSLLSLKARETPYDGARQDIEDVRKRVRTLALVHEQLLRAKSVDQVELAVYFRELCAKLLDFAGTDPEKITLSLMLEKVAVSADKAVPLGLIVNEIVSNSLEHAFPEGRGALQLHLSRAGGGKVMLVIADDGPGIPPDAKKGIGLGLVRGLAMQIRAELAVETERGTRYTLVFPA